MKVYKHIIFHKWAKSEKLSDEALLNAAEEINQGLFEAALGSGLYKKRIAVAGKGKSGGYRTLIAFRQNNIAFFVFGFTKKERANIDENEKQAYRKLARNLLDSDINSINKLVNSGILFEIK